MCNLLKTQWGKKCCPHDSFSHRFRPLCIPSIIFDLFKHLVASLRCNVELHPQQFELVDAGLLKGGRRGWRTRCVCLLIVLIYPSPFSELYAISSKPSGKECCPHSSFSSTRALLASFVCSIHCRQPFPPPRCQPCRHAVFHLQRFDLVEVGLVEGKGREGGEKIRPNVDLFSCVQDVCRSM